jgi:hypothetical protein
MTAKERLVIFIYFYSKYDVDRTKKMEATSSQSATEGVTCTHWSGRNSDAKISCGLMINRSLFFTKRSICSLSG